MDDETLICLSALQEGRCYYCGGAVEPRIEGLCQGIYCPHCAEFLIVTTYIPPIWQDETRYRVTLQAADATNPQHIRTLARITGRNYLQTRALFAENAPLLAEDRAPHMLAIKMRLDAAGIAYAIRPPFLYKVVDGEKG